MHEKSQSGWQRDHWKGAPVDIDNTQSVLCIDFKRLQFLSNIARCAIQLLKGNCGTVSHDE
jgi:hypothetical protein